MFPKITSPDFELAPALQARLNGLAKPPGSLGRIEDLALRLGLIQSSLTPTAERALLLVFAGDHGLTQDGVSSYPASVTMAMVATFLAGKASANAFARISGTDVRVVDAGVVGDVPAHPNLIQAKVRRGTRNAAREAAMTSAEVEQALKSGIDIAVQAAAEGFDTFALGEMGIGNSASASLIMHRLTGFELRQCVGRGAGHDEKGLAHKLAVLERAAARTSVTTPMDVLAEFGGCEIAMMAGAVLGAAAARRVVIVDGFISSAAALAAIRLDSAAAEYCVFSHCSAEAGHARMLEALNVKPLVQLDLRLGEGTGALLAIPLVRAAAKLLSDVATLDDVIAGRL
jgi:nicotinate-nucleotide--dimethylbenzimidazole phosphoribosyltransferase